MDTIFTTDNYNQQTNQSLAPQPLQPQEGNKIKLVKNFTQPQQMQIQNTLQDVTQSDIDKSNIGILNQSINQVNLSQKLDINLIKNNDNSNIKVLNDLKEPDQIPQKINAIDFKNSQKKSKSETINDNSYVNAEQIIPKLDRTDSQISQKQIQKQQQKQLQVSNLNIGQNPLIQIQMLPSPYDSDSSNSDYTKTNEQIGSLNVEQSKQKQFLKIQSQQGGSTAFQKVKERLSIRKIKQGQLGNTLRIMNLTDTLEYSVKFVHNMKLFWSNRPLSMANSFVIKVIQDQSYVERQTQTSIQKLKSVINQVIFGSAFHPNAIFVSIQEFMKFFLDIYILFVVSIDLFFQEQVYLISLFGFSPSEKKKPAFVIEFSILMFFFSSMIISVKTGFYKAGIPIQDGRESALNYYKNNFWYDVIGNLPLFFRLIYICNYDFELSSDSTDMPRWLSTLHILVFFKLYDLFRLVDKLEAFLHFDEKIQMIVQFINLSIQIILYTHVFGCIWYFIGDDQLKKNKDNWLENYKLTDGDQVGESSLFNRYICSIYWSFTTMVTVGYGDVTPTNTNEIIWSIITMLIGGAIFAYAINITGTILFEYGQKQRIFKKNLMIMNRFMQRNKLSLELQYRVRTYLENQRKEANSENYQEELNVLSTLGNQLKDEIFLNTYGTTMKSIKLLSKNFSEKFLRNLAHKMQEQHYNFDDEIIDPLTEDKSLFFVKKGSVTQYIPLQTDYNEVEQILGNVQVGEYFCREQFLFDKEIKFYARATSFTTLIVIKRFDFLQLLNQYPKDYEIFKMISEQKRINGNNYSLYVNCTVCQNKTHNVFSCPYVNLRLDREKIILKHNFSVFQKRVRYKRQKVKLNVKSKLQQLQQANKGLERSMSGQDTNYSVFQINSQHNHIGSFHMFPGNDQFQDNYLNKIEAQNIPMQKITEEIDIESIKVDASSLKQQIRPPKFQSMNINTQPRGSLSQYKLLQQQQQNQQNWNQQISPVLRQSYSPRQKFFENNQQSPYQVQDDFNLNNGYGSKIQSVSINQNKTQSSVQSDDIDITKDLDLNNLLFLNQIQNQNSNNINNNQQPLVFTLNQGNSKDLSKYEFAQSRSIVGTREGLNPMDGQLNSPYNQNKRQSSTSFGASLFTNNRFTTEYKYTGDMNTVTMNLDGINNQTQQIPNNKTNQNLSQLQNQQIQGAGSSNANPLSLPSIQGNSSAQYSGQTSSEINNNPSNINQQIQTQLIQLQQLQQQQLLLQQQQQALHHNFQNPQKQIQQSTSPTKFLQQQRLLQRQGSAPSLTKNTSYKDKSLRNNSKQNTLVQKSESTGKITKQNLYSPFEIEQMEFLNQFERQKNYQEFFPKFNSNVILSNIELMQKMQKKNLAEYLKRKKRLIRPCYMINCFPNKKDLRLVLDQKTSLHQMSNINQIKMQIDVQKAIMITNQVNKSASRSPQQTHTDRVSIKKGSVQKSKTTNRKTRKFSLKQQKTINASFKPTGL